MRLNKVCELEDFRDPEVASMIRWLEPDLAASNPAHPFGREHRKSWEHQHAIRGAIELAALRPDSTVLVMNAGTERLMYALTNFAAHVFAVDDYAESPGPLLAPRDFAPFAYRARRLHVQHSPPCTLNFEDATFDAVFVLRLSAFVTYESAGMALLEAGRVLKPAGIAVAISDVVIDGGLPLSIPGALLHSPESIEHLVDVSPPLRPVEPIDATVRPGTADSCKNWEAAVANNLEYPHVAFEHDGRRFTSAAAFLVRP